ncbi:MAG: MFS transporter [Bacteroidota bacterium]|nr:MFS transporter [Bacteroidota bacterium]
MASVILASAMAFIDGTALNVVLPSLQKDLHATGTDIFWMLNAYLLMLAALILPGGSLGDKLGRKKIFMAGIAFFIIGSAASGLSPTVGYLIFFRAIQGVGGALMIPGSLSIITTSFSKQERGKAIGTWSAITTMVTVGGPILGGALADAGLWRMIFFINVPIGIISLLILWRKVPESRDATASRSLDYGGSVSVIAGLALLTYGFLKIPETGINNWRVYASVAGGLVALVLFLLIENRIKNPMMPLHLFRNKIFAGANLLTFFLYAALAGAMLFLTLNMVQIQGYSQLQAGMTLLPFTILLILISRWSGRLVDKYGPRWFLILGPLTVTVGLLSLSFVKETGGPSSYWSTYFPGIVLFGLGMSFTVTPLTATVMNAVASQHSGTASGINNAISRVANVFANVILGALAILFFTGYLTRGISEASLPQTIQQKIISQSSDLGDAKVPPLVKTENVEKVKQLYKEGFINAYVKIMRICAVLALVASFTAFVFIKNEKLPAIADTG